MGNKGFNDHFSEFLTTDAIDDAQREEFVNLLCLAQRGRSDICLFVEEMLGMPLNDFQREFLTKTTTPRTEWGEKFGVVLEETNGMLFGKNIACPSNQVGKTVMTAMKHLWFNFYKIGLDLDDDLISEAYYSTLNVSPQSRQTKACYAYLLDILHERFVIDDGGVKRTNKLSPLIKDFLVGDNANLGEIRFANRSVMYTVPVGHDQASSLAGGQFGYISYDECAQSLHLQQELGAKILSRLIKYGCSLDLISTPEVDSASHQEYMRFVKLGLAGKEGWWALQGNLDQNRFIPKEQRERIKADLFSTDKQKYRQVVFGEFVTGGKRFFDMAEVDNMWRLAGKQPCIQGHKYLLVADWGMSDQGDDSVFMVLDYTDWLMNGKIYVVDHEKIKGGTPTMQFALLRTLHEKFSYPDPANESKTVFPLFLMDDKALGGVVIRKMLSSLNPKGFQIQKDEALMLTKQEMGKGRKFVECETDGSIIEQNPDYGGIRSYFIEELANQLGMYHVEDKRLTQDFVMVLMMGVSYIARKFVRAAKGAALNPLAGFEASIRRTRPVRANY